MEELCNWFFYLFQKCLRKLALEVAESETDLEDQTRKTVGDPVKKKQWMVTAEKI